jgi:F-type H+-transporting ATPase subunit b
LISRGLLGASALAAALSSLPLALLSLPVAHAKPTPAQHGGDSAHGDSAHGDAGHGEHSLEVNWFHGLLGEKAGVEPGLLWRSPGTPAPFAAQLFNTLLLVGLIVKFAGAPIANGLRARRDRIKRGMDDAAAMEREATEQLAVYRHKLDHLDDEVERVRREMKEGAETERRRVLEEAETRRVRMEQEARLLVQQELEALRERLTRETALAAVRSARELLKVQTSTDDHRRLCEDYLTALNRGDALGLRARSRTP